MFSPKAGCSPPLFFKAPEQGEADLKNNNNKIGIYIHIPFCKGKCPYCDFYSLSNDSYIKPYINALTGSFRRWSAKLGRQADTLYFGGGTPSALGTETLAMLTRESKLAFNIDDNDLPEITVECNPSDIGSINSAFDFELLAESGVNRISIGLQSVADAERSALGRRGPASDTLRGIEKAKAAGINNISLDIITGLPGQSIESLRQTLDFCIQAGVTHISAYILKIEENTPFYTRREKLSLPDENEVCDFYLLTVRDLARGGFEQYEISNFAKKGYESRHNLKYWNCDEYLGLGPSAHSFIAGRRFYYPRDIQKYIDGGQSVPDGEGGGFEEYAMLRLRLTEGLTNEQTLARFGFPVPEPVIERARRFEADGYLYIDKDGIRLSPEGFLLSNTIINNLLDAI
jgi:oxygen-independent coproporphyrinogen-3 oxidase